MAELLFSARVRAEPKVPFLAHKPEPYNLRVSKAPNSCGMTNNLTFFANLEHICNELLVHGITYFHVFLTIEKCIILINDNLYFC